ncbi:bifunctional phosphoribosylaminoimidazolecarboxamide formyltransferase/IMP cyclohydrolase [Balneolaceae bacterium ANBcel3]|nr:bifunctional phosphoribosylaminoimidazolecarboxamide formyltransferase/IMP cyclohydrolase [Balneolaceae bacterium ANBcel3]
MNSYVQNLPHVPIKRALLSVTDKTGIISLATALHKKNIEIVSTGGTATKLREAGIPVIDVSEITGFPECLDGRVKTLHPKVHGALLARPSIESHAHTLAEQDITPIQLVVINLYRFSDAVSSRPDELEFAIQNIDIGGPAMVRASAKNFENVCVLTHPDQYNGFLEELNSSNEGISGATRFELSCAAFHMTASYDTMISNHLGRFDSEDGQETTENLSVQEPLFQSLRYGENPHQPACVYGNPDRFFTCFHGKELSYNNYLDIDAALSLGADFIDSEDTLCAIFKHSLPCGVALGETPELAWEKAFSTDTTSPFGGIVLFNRPLDLAGAKAVDAIFTEIILAPDYSEEAMALLEKKANRRLVRIHQWPDTTDSHIRSIAGGYLSQQPDMGFAGEERKVVTKRAPEAEEMETMEFAWKVVKHVKSNAIVYAKNKQTIGIGTGQPNRVDSSRFAVQKAETFGHSVKGSVLASDAFFPFSDGVEEAAKAGASAVIQPGGSVRDQEVIEVANQYNLSMIFTGKRHFRH